MIERFAAGWTWTVGKDFVGEGEGVVTELFGVIRFSKKPKRDHCGGQ